MDWIKPSTQKSSSSSSDTKLKLTVTKALVDLKTLDKRIQKLISESVFVSLKGELRKSDIKISKAQSNYDKIRDLLTMRVKLKSALVISNATTRVKVADMDMTVAEAIELKSSIKNYKTLLGKLRDQFGACNQQMEHDNQRVRQSLESTLKKTEDTKEQMISLDYIRSHMKIHGVEMDDPIDAQKKMDELETFITNFEDSVDVVLSVTNATTQIEI